MVLATRPLLLVLLAAVLMAGCAANPGPDDARDDGPPAPMSGEQARTLLAEAARNTPEQFATDMRITRGTEELVAFKASFDNRTDRTYVELKGDAAALGGSMAGGEQFAALLAQGLSLYHTPEGSLYLVNGTAYVFPPEDKSQEEPSSFVPSPSEGPLGALLTGDDLLGALGASNLTVTSVTPTLYRGEPAVEVVATRVERNETIFTKIVLFTQPARVARIETTLPADPENPTDPLAGATLAGDLYYNNELALAPPPATTRALGLAYSTGQPDFFGGGGGNLTWTFRASEGIALSEVEVHVKAATQDGGMDLASLPTAWAMPLSEGTRTHEGVTLAFTDADADGKVSAGDTLVASTDDDTVMPPILLHDRVTGTYVIPGPGLLLAGFALGVAALLARRR